MPRMYNRPLASQTEISGMGVSCSVYTLPVSAGASRAAENAIKPLSREQQVRRAVLLSFCDPVPAEVGRLLHLSRRKWVEITSLAGR